MHRLTEFSLRRPWLTLSILLAITVGLGVGIPNVKPGYGYRVQLGEQHMAVKNLNALIEEFSGGLPVQIAWECGPGQPCASVFDESSLSMVDGLSHDLEQLPLIRAVESPSTAALLVPADDGFAVRRLVENGVVAPDAEVLGQRAVDDRLWRDTLVSPDGRVGVLIVQPIDNRPQTEPAVVDAINHALEEREAKGFTFYLVGQAPANVMGGRSLAESTGQLTPVLVLLIGVVLLFFTRSWQQTLVILVSTGIALLWALGLLGWLGWPRDGMLQVLAPLVLVFGVCDGMHLLSRYAAERGASPTGLGQEALQKASKDTGAACLITTLTTAAALLSFTASDLDTFVRFGLITAFGVVACLFLTFTLLPILLERLPADTLRVERVTSAWNDVMETINQTTKRRSGSLLMASIVLFVFFAWGWSQLRADTDWIESWGEESEIVESIRFFEDRLGLSQSLELDIELPEGVAIENPETLRKVEAISRDLVELPEFTQATSAATLMKRLNRLLHDDQAQFERLGESQAANAELLETLGFDDPETLGRWLSLDRSRLRISLDAQLLSQISIMETLAQVDRITAKYADPDWRVVPSGELAIVHDGLRDLQSTQLRSFPIAFGIVFLLVSIFLRSWKLGLAAMVPTLLPVVVVLGAMGWLGMSLDVARAMIAAVVIGIGVDDAIHLLAHYKVRREEGDTPQAAMSAALQHTGRAIVTTSIALALGFLTLMMSAWQTVASFGFFVALSILGALVATLLVLPALVFAFAPKGVSADESAAGAFQSLTPAPAAGPDGEE